MKWDRESILEVMMETIAEREVAIQASGEAKRQYEKSEFYDGFNIIEVTDEKKKAAA